MDFTMITQIIGSLGFPIAACGYMMVTMNSTLKANTDATNKLSALVTALMAKHEGPDSV